MPDDKKRFELGDYVEVKDRIKLFYELYGNGRLVTESVTFPVAGDGKARVMVSALAYRTPDDPLPGTGFSWLELPGKTPYTNGSEVENAETSAWGRAIGSLGILIDKSIASGNEIRNKEQPAAPSAGPITVGADTAFSADGGLIGTAIAQGTQDFELRQSPTGYTLPFRIKNGTKSYIVMAEGELAEAIAAIKPTVMGQRITAWGRWSDETSPAKGTKPAINYRILHLERLATPDGILPAPKTDTPLPEPPDDVPLVGEHEAETAPLFDDVPVAS